MIYSQTFDTPLGAMTVRADEEAILSVCFGADGENAPNSITRETVRELGEYFDGKRQVFDLPLKPQGTEFQQKVRAALLAVGYGQTRTYGDIAAAVGNKNACRAVGGAVNRNPVAIIIPCHRIVGADGALTGYNSGLDKKEFLLALENNNH